MKHTIEGFSQRELIRLGLDVTDACILRWFVDFSSSGRMVKNAINGNDFFWVKYSGLSDHLPVLGLGNPETVARRFSKMEQAGIFSKEVVKTARGTFTFFCVRSFLGLIDDTPPDSKVESAPDSGVETPPDSKVDPKDSSPKKNSSSKESIAESAVSYLNEKTGSKFRTYKNTGLLGLITSGTTLDTIKAVIDLKVSKWTGTDMAQYLTPSTLFRASNFEKYENELRLPNSTPLFPSKEEPDDAWRFQDPLAGRL